MSRPAPTPPHAPRPHSTGGLSTETVAEPPGDRRRMRTDRRLSLRKAVVVAVRENFSVARMVYTREEVNVGDRVIVQP